MIYIYICKYICYIYIIYIYNIFIYNIYIGVFTPTAETRGAQF